MLRLSVSLLFCLVATPVWATPEIDMIEDLKKVDQFNCDIEDRGNNQIRILTTSWNSKTNRYFDLNLNSQDMKLEKTADGWKIEKTIDLGEKAIAPLFPKFLYGSEITKLNFKTEADGSSYLSVQFTPSTTSIGSTTKFECSGSEGVELNKSLSCPTCVSSK